MIDGNYLKRLRCDHLLMTQAQLAEALETTQAVISVWENGSSISIAFKRKIRDLAQEKGIEIDKV